METDLRWQTLNPAALAGGTALARGGIDALDTFWTSVVRPSVQANIAVTRLMSQIVGSVAAPVQPGVQDLLGEVVETLGGFATSGVYYTAHHNVRRNPRWDPAAVARGAQVLDEAVATSNAAATRYPMRLAYPPREGSLTLSFPGGVTVQDEAGELVGSTVAAGSVDYSNRRIVLDFSTPPAAGAVTATYTRSGVLTQDERDGVIPWTGTGVDGFIDDLTRTFPSTFTRQSLSGVLFVGGSRAPAPFGNVLNLLGRLFSDGLFLRMESTFSRIGTQVGANAVAAFGPFEKAGAHRFRDAAPLGPPFWRGGSLADALPPIGEVYTRALEVVERLTPPRELTAGVDAVLNGLDEKVNTFTALLDQVSGAVDELRFLSEAQGANVYLLPLVEMNADDVTTPLGATATGSVFGGSRGTAVFSAAVQGALWPEDPSDPDTRYVSEPPESLRGDAFVAGGALVSLSGQVGNFPTAATGTPTATQLLSTLFGFKAVQSGETFGSAVRELPSRPPTATPVAAP